MWNYDLSALQSDDDIISTINNYGNAQDLQGVLGNPVFDSDTGLLVEAEAISLSYFLEDRSTVENGSEVDPVNAEWESSVFLTTVQEADEVSDLDDNNNNKDENYLEYAYFSTRSFEDEFGGEISGDLIFVNISYLVAFIFLGATMGSKVCGRGSRWTMSFSALLLVALSTVAGFGIASLAGLIYGPVHSVLPFVLLGIGVDDAFVIANSFDSEREGVSRESEDDGRLIKRGARALARSGASISVTSLTDLVAFAISSSSALPALASFCAFASINVRLMRILYKNCFYCRFVSSISLRFSFFGLLVQPSSQQPCSSTRNVSVTIEEMCYAA